VKVFITSSKYKQKRYVLINIINNSRILDKHHPANDNVTKLNYVDMQKFV